MKWLALPCIIFMVIQMNRLKELRIEKGIKQIELARLMSVGQQTVSRYETGERDLSTEAISFLCRLFGCTADYLLGFSSRRENAVSAAEAELLQAYKDASDRDRKLVDDILAAYKKQTPAAAG